MTLRPVGMIFGVLATGLIFSGEWKLGAGFALQAVLLILAALIDAVEESEP